MPREETLYHNAYFAPMTHLNPLAPSPPSNPGVYEPLFVFDSINFDLIPWIAESYEWTDELTLKLTLRAEPKWWDNKSVTSEDVKYTFELGKRRPEVAWATLKTVWVYVDSIDVPNDRTVIFHLKPENPCKLIMREILTTSPVLCKDFWSGIEEEYEDLTEFNGIEVVSSGPYKVIFFSADKFIRERVEDWWGNAIFGKPAPKYVVGLNVRNNPFCNSLVAKGDIDWSQCFMPEVWELRPTVITWYDREPWLMPTPDRTGGYECNVNRYPLSLWEFRHAIAYAIDVKEVSRKAFSHYAVLVDPSFIREDSPLRKFVNESAVKEYGFIYDLEEAKRRLDNLKFIDRNGDGVRETPNGTKLEFEIVVVDGWTDWEMACAILKDNMKDVGITIHIRAMDYPSWADRVRRRDFDFKPVQMDAWGPTGVWGFYRVLYDTRVPEWPMTEGKCSGYFNPEVEELIDEIGATPLTDETKLKELYGRLHAIIAKDMPAIPVWSWGGIGIYSTKYWVGWPTKDNPYSPAEPGWNFENLLTLINIKSAGAPGVVPPVEVPLPPEVAELPERFVTLENAVKEVGNEISAARSDMTELSRELAGLSSTLTTIMAIQTATLIALAIVSVILVRKR